MLVPISLLLITLLTFALGMTKRSNGIRNQNLANEIAVQAREHYEAAFGEYNKDLKVVHSSLEKYGLLQIFVKQRVIGRCADFLRSINQQAAHNANKKFASELEGTSLEQIQEYEFTSITARETITSFISSTRVGLVAGSGSIGIAQAFGTVTVPHFFGLWTTKIAVAELGLGGVISWLGGGSLLIGISILVCITLGPTLAIEGFRSASKGEEDLTQAQDYSTKLNLEAAVIETKKVFLQQVEIRIKELDELLLKFTDHAILRLIELERSSFDSDRDADRFQQLMLFIKALQEVSTTPILEANEDNRINPAIESIKVKYSELWGETFNQQGFS